jgi:hypothetical protein
MALAFRIILAVEEDVGRAVHHHGWGSAAWSNSSWVPVWRTTISTSLQWTKSVEYAWKISEGVRPVPFVAWYHRL